MEQLASSSRTEMNNNRCCTATITVTLRIIKTNSVPASGIDFIFVQYVSDQVSVTTVFIIGQPSVLTGQQITETYVLMAADTPRILSVGEEILNEEGHAYCTLGVHMFIGNFVETRYKIYYFSDC